MTAILFLLIGVIFLGITVGLVRFHRSLVYWVVSIYALTAWEYPNFGNIGTFGGTTVTFGDGIAVSLFVAALFDARELLKRLRPQALIAASLLTLLLIVSLARGVAEYGLGVAVNEFRGFLYVLGILSWALTREWSPSELVRAQKFFVVVQGVGLCVVAVYHVLRFGLGGTADFVVVNGELSQTGRPLVSGQAFLLVLCAVLALRIWQNDGRFRYMVMFTVFTVVAILSQQRTVWLAIAAVGLLLVVRGSWSLRQRLIPIFSVLLLVGVVVVLARSSVSTLVDEFAGSASNTGTYDARLTSWSGLIVQSFDSGPLSVLFGEPFGHGFARFEGVGRLVVFAPHNWYVTVYLRAGLLGLVAMLVVFLPRVLAGLMRGRDVFLGCILVCFLVYGWTYSWQWWTCLPLALAFIDQKLPVSDPRFPTPPLRRKPAVIGR